MKNVKEIRVVDYSSLPKKVLQFGEGNFLRAFADYIIQKMNECGVFNGSVVMVKPTSSESRLDFNSQNCRYTVLERGIENGKRVDRACVVTSVSDYLSAYQDSSRLLDFAVSEELQVIISNTTEAGIIYNKGEKFSDFPYVSFPAKLCRLLFERFKVLGGGYGPLILPLELIENNGDTLKNCILSYASDWRLGDDFAAYVNHDCKFCSTLVDRIVTGFPAEDADHIFSALGYSDSLAVACEPYISWIIEGCDTWRAVFPADRIFGNVKWVRDVAPYRERKVKLLNGAHTLSVYAGFLCGHRIVRDMVSDPDFSAFLNRALENEIIPTLSMDNDKLEAFKKSVSERFMNPFIDHKLLDISLNGVSKFKARCFLSIIQYAEKFGTAPTLLSFSFASFIKFYNGSFDGDGKFVSNTGDEDYIVRDSKSVLTAFEAAFKFADPVFEIMKNTSLWGMDLTHICGFYEKVSYYFDNIVKYGARTALRKALRDE